jgi:predicted phosphate transport protein (TIGR00153 family)
MRFIRTPIIQTLRKSPFEALIDHATYVKESANLLRKAFADYLEENYEDFEKKRKEIEELELKADYIKSNIRNHLPKGVWMPVDRSVFLSLLSEMDKVEDIIQDVTEWLSLRKKPVHKELKNDFEALFEKSLESIELCEDAIYALNLVIESSFLEKEREKTKEIVHKLHIVEHESDLLERKLTREIFAIEDKLSAAALFHLSKLVFLLGEIANHAENAGDRVRALIAR